MNIINILNKHYIERSSELSYHGDTPVLNPSALLDILITELPLLFKDIMRDLGFDVSNWPDSFHITQGDNENPLLTIIYPSLTGKGKTINDILAHTKGPVLILDSNPIFSPILGQGRQIVPISMSDLAVEILRRLGGYNISASTRKRIEEMCKVWILIGLLYQGPDIKKTFGEQPSVRFNIPTMLWSVMNQIGLTELNRKIWIMLEEKLSSEINTGAVVTKEVMPHSIMDMTSSRISSSPYVIFTITFTFPNRPFEVYLSQSSNDIVISYSMLGESGGNVYLTTKICTTDSLLYNKIKNTWPGWLEGKVIRQPNELQLYRKQDITRRIVQDVLDEIVNNICDFVRGGTNIYQ